MFKFTIRELFLITVVAALVIALWLYPKIKPPGRYQIAADQPGRAFLLDTATGQCWRRSYNGTWTDEPMPVFKKK